GYFVNAALNDQATGDLPRDPKERDRWKLEGKQPNSILIHGYSVSYNRFGPIGNLANLGANLAYVIPHLTDDDDENMTKAVWHAAFAAEKMVTDEVGMLTLANIFEAIHDDKKGTAFVANTASSFVPFSSFLSQSAFAMDPHMRAVKSFTDGIKNRIPFLRETLLPQRDWSGQPVDNPSYHSLVRMKQVNSDPVDREMATLGVHPAPPANHIGGVQLPPRMYDEYQTRAGAITRPTLEHIIQQPGWSGLPAFARKEIIQKTIAATRQAAGATMQIANPQIIWQGVKNRVDQINGQNPTKLKEV